MRIGGLVQSVAVPGDNVPELAVELCMGFPGAGLPAWALLLESRLQAESGPDRLKPELQRVAATADRCHLHLNHAGLVCAKSGRARTSAVRSGHFESSDVKARPNAYLPNSEFPHPPAFEEHREIAVFADLEDGTVLGGGQGGQGAGTLDGAHQPEGFRVDPENRSEGEQAAGLVQDHGAVQAGERFQNGRLEVAQRGAMDDVMEGPLGQARRKILRDPRGRQRQLPRSSGRPERSVP